MLFGRIRSVELPYSLDEFLCGLRVGLREIPISPETLVPIMPHSSVAYAWDPLRCRILLPVHMSIRAPVRD